MEATEKIKTLFDAVCQVTGVTRLEIEKSSSLCYRQHDRYSVIIECICRILREEAKLLTYKEISEIVRRPKTTIFCLILSRLKQKNKEIYFKIYKRYCEILSDYQLFSIIEERKTREIVINNFNKFKSSIKYKIA